MLVAGIAWSAQGFEVAVLDARGAAEAAVIRFPAGSVRALTEHLVALDAASAGLVCVVDSTNGMIDGGLMAAGLRVHRADPWTLPPRPGLGSVDAVTLARAGVTRLHELTRLVLEGGSLTGRSDELVRHLQQSEPTLAALTAAGGCLAHGPREEKLVALTFDDGPHPPYTGRVLDVLDRYGVPATFFCVGLHASGHPDEVARIAASGHRLANHTWSHPFLPDLSVAELSAQLERTDEAIEEVAGRPARRLFRPPYGSRTAELLSWVGGDGDRTVVLWDVEAADWSMPGADAIAGTVLHQVRPGSIVLLHDGGGDRSQTAEALPAIVEGLLAQDYRFVVVDELAG